MANVLNRTTKQYLLSVNTPDYPETEWIINPDLSGVKDLPVSHWIIDGDSVRPPNEEEAPAINAGVLEEQKMARLAEIDGRTAFLLQQPIEIEPGAFVDMTSDTYKTLQDIVVGVSFGVLSLPQSIPLTDGGSYTIELNSDLAKMMGIIIGRRRSIAETANRLRNTIKDATSLELLEAIIDTRE